MSDNNDDELLQLPDEDDDTVVRRNFKYRIYPTKAQDKKLRGWESTLRFLSNVLHEQRLIELHRPEGRSLVYRDIADPTINELRATRKELEVFARESAQYATQQQNKAIYAATERKIAEAIEREAARRTKAEAEGTPYVPRGIPKLHPVQQQPVTPIEVPTRAMTPRFIQKLEMTNALGEFPWLAEVPSHARQAVCETVFLAWRRFFKKIDAKTAEALGVQGKRRRKKTNAKKPKKDKAKPDTPEPVTAAPGDDPVPDRPGHEKAGTIIITSVGQPPRERFMPRFKQRGEAMRIYTPAFGSEGVLTYTLTGGRRDGQLRIFPEKFGLGVLKIALDRPPMIVVRGVELPTRITSWTLKREGDEWYAIAALSAPREALPPAPPTNEAVVGIDRGVALFAADSDGRTVENPRFGHDPKTMKQIKRLQRQFARQRRAHKAYIKATTAQERTAAREAYYAALAAGDRAAAREAAKHLHLGKNMTKTRQKIAKLQRQVARRREVFVNTQSKYYAERYGTVVLEDLSVKAMTASAKGTAEAPGKNVAAKAGLNRNILDSSWGQFKEKLGYKLAANGGRLVTVPAAKTSQTCAVCGHVDAESRVTQAKFVCTACGHTDNADLNAAKNILARGLVAEPEEKIRTRLATSLTKVAKQRRKAVKPTVEPPVEDACSQGADEAGTIGREADPRIRVDHMGGVNNDNPV